MRVKNKKFISIIWWYHKQIFSFHKEQNYHMAPLQAMLDAWYQCEIYAINSHVKIEQDPNFIPWLQVIYHKSIFLYLWYLFKNREYILYSNSLTIKTLLVGIIGRKTVFYPHSYPFGSSLLKKKMIVFFYAFFSKVRVNNTEEYVEIEKIRSGLAHICPLSISKCFLQSQDSNYSKTIIWVWNLTEIKQPEILLDTMDLLQTQHPDTILYIIGQDRYNVRWSNFQHLIDRRKLQKNIILLGEKSHAEVAEILKKSCIYVNTSRSEWQCIAVYEAALAWNILCLPNILAFPSVFWKNAFYYETPKELAENISTILDDRKKYTHMVKWNKKMILEWYQYKKNQDMLQHLFTNF